MTGFDRNSDIVFAAAYAPLLNVSHPCPILGRSKLTVNVCSISQARNGCVRDTRDYSDVVTSRLTCRRRI